MIVVQPFLPFPVSSFPFSLHLRFTFGGKLQAAYGNWGRNERHPACRRYRTESNNNQPNSRQGSVLHKRAKPVYQECTAQK